MQAQGGHRAETTLSRKRAWQIGGSASKKCLEYEPFGSLLPGRNYSATTSDYRYGFNGKESDGEINGERNSYDFGARMHDPRVGRFLSLDPFASAFAFQSPYLFAGNNPIQFIDHNGEFKLSKKLQKKYPLLTNVLVAISNEANNNPQSALVSIFMERTGASREQALNILTWKSGPKVGVGRPEGDASAHTSLDGSIVINKTSIKRLHDKGLPDLNKSVGLYWAFITMWHEGGHAGDLAVNGGFTDDQIGADGLPKGILDIGGDFDIGVRMERDLGLPAELYNDATKTRTMSFIGENTSLSIEPFGVLNQSNILGFFGRNQSDQRGSSGASEPADLGGGLPLLMGRERQGDTP